MYDWEDSLALLITLLIVAAVGYFLLSQLNTLVDTRLQDEIKYEVEVMADDGTVVRKYKADDYTQRDNYIILEFRDAPAIRINSKYIITEIKE